LISFNQEEKTMSAATSLLTPDEQFIQEVLRSGRATRQEVSLKAIGTPDVNLQARVVHLDMDHCSRLERAAMEQGDLAPAVLFRDARTNKLYLADGHHRHFVYCNMLKPKRTSIPAYVIDSPNAEQEALEFATMCNREMCLGRKPEDMAKAVEMLLLNEKTRMWSDRRISDHVGCMRSKVGQVRGRLKMEVGLDFPEIVIGFGNQAQPYRQRRGSAVTRKIGVGNNGSGKTRFEAKVDGRLVCGRTPEAVREKLAAIDEIRDQRRSSLRLQSIRVRLEKHGFSGVLTEGHSRFPGMRGIYRSGIVCLPCDFSPPEALPMVIGQLIAAQEYKEPAARMIVLCYVEDGPEVMMDLYRRKGFEFMTPDELVESLKGGA
jgi:hypothetical protein